MSQNNINDSKSANSAELSMHPDYLCFMSEDSKDSLDVISDAISLMIDYLELTFNDGYVTGRERGVRSICQLIDDKLNNVKSELNYPGGIFSEFQAVHGIRLIQKHGVKKITKALEQLSDEER